MHAAIESPKDRGLRSRNRDGGIFEGDLGRTSGTMRRGLCFKAAVNAVFS